MENDFRGTDLASINAKEPPVILSDEKLLELRDIAKKATKGAWSYGCDWGDLGAIVSVGDSAEFVYGGSKLNRPFSKVPEREQDANARYIASFGPRTGLAMIKEIERLRKEQK